MNTFCFVLFCRLKQKIVELQTFRQQCGDLEQKVTDFIQEKEQFEKEVFHQYLLRYTIITALVTCKVSHRF